VGRNKRCLTLNPLKPDGAQVLKRLVATADVVVANLPPKTLSAMGLDYESLKAVKSDIILTTVNAFASGGPYSDRVGFDALAQAMSGNLHLSGEAEQPTRAFVPYVDFATAALSAFSTLAALRHRDQTGEGQVLEGALLKTALTMMNSVLIEQDVKKVDRVATMNRGQWNGPSDVFRTQDGWIMCLAIGAQQFSRWCDMVGQSELVDDPRFTDDLARGDHGEALSNIMMTWCQSRTQDEVLSAMDDAKIPAGPVYSPQQALDDEHIQALNFLKAVDYPTATQSIPTADFPVSMSASRAEIRHRAPMLGEHTDEILVELGYDAASIEDLRSRRVV
jgi:crotonobetainyl-CoA:carnitine CoA-transferase CaiB-like acyl-CoA transferase